MQLTDSMIERALQDTSYVSESPWKIVGILSVLILFFCLCFFMFKEKPRKIIAVVFVIFLLISGIVIISRDNKVKKQIENGEWYVATDTVDRVLEESKRVSKSYHMVLDEYGHVSLKDYEEAKKYYSGATVYLIVVPNGNEYKSIGITYNADKYVYVGNHLLPQ